MYPFFLEYVKVAMGRYAARLSIPMDKSRGLSPLFGNNQGPKTQLDT